MTHTSTEQPVALRLAEFFESMRKSSHRWYDGTPVHEKAAAELRRLHARVQELEDLNNQLCEQQESLSNAYVELKRKYIPVCYRATPSTGITQEKQG